MSSEAQRCNQQIDVYGFAIICWELFHAPWLPWDGLADKDIEEKVMKGDRPRIGASVPDEWKDLMEEMWNSDPQSRPSFSAVVSNIKAFS